MHRWDSWIEIVHVCRTIVQHEMVAQVLFLSHDVLYWFVTFSHQMRAIIKPVSSFSRTFFSSHARNHTQCVKNMSKKQNKTEQKRRTLCCSFIAWRMHLLCKNCTIDQNRIYIIFAAPIVISTPNRWMIKIWANENTRFKHFVYVFSLPSSYSKYMRHTAIFRWLISNVRLCVCMKLSKWV